MLQQPLPTGQWQQPPPLGVPQQLPQFGQSQQFSQSNLQQPPPTGQWQQPPPLGVLQQPPQFGQSQQFPPSALQQPRPTGHWNPEIFDHHRGDPSRTFAAPRENAPGAPLNMADIEIPREYEVPCQIKHKPSYPDPKILEEDMLFFIFYTIENEQVEAAEELYVSS
ncbi:unnamed protein product [Gongylonema pulchrum]|uniref:NOT2_3_5 domain-containing protein n=1 Tax=Gongylonema pulchrum TaxID=637853 RepID=A0A183D860_9BILA|nr:unnamed protein product [Gongylonema pulchrum]